ncbi:MAG: MOSC domain-containing protein [Gemmatimonadales bacterium]|nr:MOSC domain-containing protein [Gemmatimonadales bacterium]
MHLTSIHRYPIKGCRGHALDSAEVDALGLVGDRRFLVVDSNDRFVSQREAAVLATLTPMFDGATLTVEAARHEPLVLELDPQGASRDVTIWDDQVTATDQGESAARWFSAVIGHPCRLVHFGGEATRRLDPKFSPRPEAETAFTDGYPMLGVLQESLDDLNGRLATPVPMARFRPNLVFAGAPAWSEDGWTELEVSGLILDAVKPCGRCVVTTTDQLTGARDPQQEPLRTLATFRNIPGRGTMFGMNLVARGSGVVNVEQDDR